MLLLTCNRQLALQVSVLLEIQDLLFWRQGQSNKSENTLFFESYKREPVA